MTRLITILAVLGLLAGCMNLRDSKLNPRNWFGRSKEERVAAAVVETSPADTHQLVDQIASLKADRLPGGAIIRVTGLPATLGYWDATLEPLNGEKPDKGTLVYELRAQPPKEAQPAGTPRTREIVAAHFISNQTLIGVRRIQVNGLKNRRWVRR